MHTSLPYNLYCVGGDVKHCSLTHTSRGDWNQPFLQLLDLRELDLGSSHTTCRRVSLIDLYLHDKFCWNWHWDQLQSEEST